MINRESLLHRLQSLQQVVVGIRRWATAPSRRPWLLGIAATIFAVMAVSSFLSLPADEHPAKPWLLLGTTFVAAPATLAINAFEYRAMAKAAGHRVRMSDATQVSLIASLANLLPVPGGVAVRAAALKKQGSTIGAALSANAVAGIIWVAVTSVMVGIALLVAGYPITPGLALSGSGTAGLAVAAIMLRRSVGGWLRTFCELLVIEFGSTSVAALRVTLSFAAIGQATPLVGMITISSSQIIAAAIGIFPGGLGLREMIAGGLSTMVGIPAAVAVAASAVDRVAVQIGMALCAPAVGVHLRSVLRSRTTDDEDAGDPGKSDVPEGSDAPENPDSSDPAGDGDEASGSAPVSNTTSSTSR